MWVLVPLALLFCAAGLIALTTSADRAWQNMQRRNGARGVARERTPEWDARYRSGRWLGGGSMLLGGLALLAWTLLRLLLVKQ